MSRLKAAMVGCGGFGTSFAPYVMNHADLVAVCDPNAESRAACLKTLNLDLPQFDDHQSLLAGIEFDAVVIASSNHTHAPLALAAANAGKHIFCEKAMASNVHECWAMVRAAEANGVKLMIGHKRRLRPPWARMIELAQKELGAPLAIEVPGFHDGRLYNFGGTWWAQKEKSGGTFALAGVHPVDWMRGMAGDIRQVSAVAGPRRDRAYDFPDIMAATYVFESGTVGCIQVALDWPLLKFRETFGPQVVCELGGIRLVPTMDYIDLFWTKDGEETIRHERFDDLGFDHAYNLEFGDFVCWIAEDRPPCLTWQEGLRCVEAMEAAYHSAEQDGAPVTLPLYPELEPEQPIEL